MRDEFDETAFSMIKGVDGEFINVGVQGLRVYIADELRKAYQKSKQESLSHLAAERAAVVEMCARACEYDLKIHPQTHCAAQVIRSLAPADALQEEIRKARLEEAKWWRDQVPGILTKDGAKMASERLASLQPPAQNGSGSRG